MRVTGGTTRGQILKVPKNYDIRPTTDRVRGAIFSMLASISTDWSRVLDLYAGTGALGIEALSRGAEWVDFVEKEPKCCAMIKQNLETMRFRDRAKVYCLNVNKAVNELNNQYDLIVMDPPYADKTIEEVIKFLDTSDFLKENSLLVVTHSSRVDLNPELNVLCLIKQRKHGDTCISIYHKEADN